MSVTTGHFGFAHLNPQSVRDVHRDNPQSGVRNPSAMYIGTIRNSSGGFTLMELLVSIAILTGIILIVSSLLANAQRAVGLSQSTIAADADARAAVNRMRADLAGLTNEGFLVIVGPTASSPPVLMFTTVGPYEAKSLAHEGEKANAAVICYSIRQDSGDGNKKNVLVREANLLTLPEGGTLENWTDDVMNRYLAHIRNYSRTELASTKIISALADNYQSINTVPNSIDDIRNLWPLLAKPVQMKVFPDFSVEWTDDGATWNGFRQEWNEGEGKWEFKVSPDPLPKPNFDPNDDGQVQWQRSNGAYMAMWTFKRKDLWPAALRITFTLGETRTYEVIVDLPR